MESPCMSQDGPMSLCESSDRKQWRDVAACRPRAVWWPLAIAMVCTPALAWNTGNFGPEAPVAEQSDPSNAGSGDAELGPEHSSASISETPLVEHRTQDLTATSSNPEDRPLGGSRSEGRGGDGSVPTSGAGKSRSSIADNWLLRTGGALALVVTLAVALRGLIRRAARSGGGLLAQLGPGGRAPSGVLEVLGRYPVARGQTLVLLRLDRRVLLTCQTSSGFTTLCQLTDPDDVASILIKTRDEDGESMAARFNALLRDMERDPSIVDDESSTQVGIGEAGEGSSGNEGVIGVLGPRSPRAAFFSRRDSASDGATDGVISGGVEDEAFRGVRA